MIFAGMPRMTEEPLARYALCVMSKTVRHSHPGSWPQADVSVSADKITAAPRLVGDGQGVGCTRQGDGASLELACVHLLGTLHYAWTT